MDILIRTERELIQERKEILEQLRDHKKEMLLSLLENNINATRRLRALNEALIGRTINSELETEETEETERDCSNCLFEDECYEDEEKEYDEDEEEYEDEEECVEDDDDEDDDEEEGDECVCSFCKEEKEEEDAEESDDDECGSCSGCRTIPVTEG